jgi:predicted dehydrogenase
LIRVGVIGCGYWGPNLLRNFADAEDCELVAASDLKAARLDLVKRRYPGIEVTTDAGSLIANPSIDAVAIATPVSTHHDLALKALRAGKHVLVEKPLAATSRQARELVLEAERLGRVLLVDHTFLYTGAVRRIHQLVQDGELGELYYYDAVRINLGHFQHDVNVVWDLAVHDVSILDHVVPERARWVSATGVSHVPGGHEDMAYLALHYESPMLSHIHVNWLAPVKIRRTLIGGSRRMILYDDMELEKIRVYDRGITFEEASEEAYALQIDYRTGDMWAPRLDVTEALGSMISDFVRCIGSRARPLTDGEAGLRIVCTLESACQSMAEGGRRVDIPGD